MSEEGNFNHPRMADYLQPEELNLDGCISLATAVLAGAAEDYLHAARQYRANPHSESARAHYRTCRNFYLSDYFQALSGGLVDGKAVLKELDDRV